MTATHYLVMDLQFEFTGEAGTDTGEAGTDTGEAGTDTDEAFDAFTDRVLEALADLERVDPGLTDPDIVAAIATREMALSMRIEADTLPDAFRIFSANVRTALHVAGCRTAGWPVFKPEGEGLPPARKVDLADA